MEINQLLEGSQSNFKNLQADASRLADKWTQSGLLEGYTNEIEKNNMAMILENQAKQIVSEASSTNSGGASFNTAGGGEQWAGVALPLVRKVFAQIASKDFVSVQPMNLPSGLVFYLDFKYGTAKDGKSIGDNMYGNVSTANDKMDVAEDAKDGLYGAGRFGYSINQSTSGDITMAASAAAGKFTVSGVTAVSLNHDSEEIARTAALVTANKLKVVSVPVASLPDFDKEGIRAFVIEGDKDAKNYPAFTTLAGGNVNFVVETNAVLAVGDDIQVLFNVQPKDNARGDFEDAAAPAAGDVSSLPIPEINVELASEAIVAKTRKLKAQWTPEFSQDLNAYHSIDAEAELTSLLSEYISMEIDLEILDMLIQGAVTVEHWSAENNKVLNADGTSFVAAGSDYYNTQGQWFQTLGTKIQKVSNKIHQKTLRGGANFLVCSPSVATILESIPGYAANTDGDKMDFAFGVQKVGSLNGRYKVYKNPYMTENTILTGYRGSQFLETGAVYAPYVPLMMTPLVYDPVSFTPRKGIMTRYAKKMIRPEFYGKIHVAGLQTI